MKKILAATGTALILSASVLLSTSAANASVPSAATIGIPATSSGNTFEFPGTSTTATLTVTNADFHPKSDFAGQTGYFSAYQLPMTPWSNASTFDSSAYTPTSIYDTSTFGLGFGWESTTTGGMTARCASLTSPLTPGVVYPCVTDSVVTLTFSQPVTDPILNINDLAGGDQDAAFYSDYTLATPGSLELLSHAGNFEVHPGGTSFGVIQSPGTGFAGSREFATTNLPNAAHPDMYGTGSGAVKVVGTYTTLSFNVTVNYRNFTTAESGLSPARTSVQFEPEWVELVPAVDFTSTATAAPSNSSLASTGAHTEGVGIAAILGVLGVGALVFARRKRTTR